MFRILLILVSFVSLLTLTACSYRYDFVVINKSDQSIEVRYQLKRYTPATPGKFVDITPPAKLTVTEFQKSERQWHNLPEAQYTFDKLTGTFTVTVAPDEVLLVDYAYNYRGDENEFSLANLKITGARGSINLEGRQAQTQFKVESDTNYVLRYR